MRVELVPINNQAQKHTFTIADQSKLLLGRGEDADMQILDAGLSRAHCVIERRGDQLTIRDAESRNGTWVNGKRIEEAALCHGDSLQFGGAEFAVELHSRPGITITERTPEGGIRREFKKHLDLDDSDLLRPSSASLSVKNLQRVQRDLATIYKVGNLINAETGQGELYDRILDEIFEVLYPDRGFLLVLPESGAGMEVVSQKPRSLAKNHNFSRTVATECLQRRVSIMRLDALSDRQYGRAKSVIEQKIHSVMCAPVESLRSAYGVIYIDRLTNPNAFSRRDLELLSAIAKQAGIAIERTRLLGRVRRMMYSTVRALVASIEAKDEDTKGHSLRVTNYALRLARELQISDEDTQSLELASLLHDVGKIGVDIDVLRKPSALTEEEYFIIQAHPVVGAEIVSNIEASESITEIVRHHHERWDGRGYPDGISKDKISLMARILAVADSFDAMTSTRPYRPRMEMDAVVSELKEGAGTQFDPQVAKAALSQIEAGRLAPRIPDSLLA